MKGELKAIFCGDGAFTWQGISCAGRVFTPDMTKAYAGFKLSKAFPMVTELGFALAPAVVARSWQTLQDQQVNLFHQLKVYDAENRKRDRIVGSVVAVEFPAAPNGGWNLAQKVDDAPMISGVMTLAKLADGMDKFLGGAQSSKRNFTVSMEVFSQTADGGFAVKMDNFLGGLDWKWTPDDFRAQGWVYVPWENADEELRNTITSVDGVRVVTKWRQNQTVFLQGGLNGEVHYGGVGLVNHGYEPSAELDRILAGAREERKDDLGLPVKELFAPMEQIVRQTEKCISSLDSAAKK